MPRGGVGTPAPGAGRGGNGVGPSSGASGRCWPEPAAWVSEGGGMLGGERPGGLSVCLSVGPSARRDLLLAQPPADIGVCLRVLVVVLSPKFWKDSSFMLSLD